MTAATVGISGFAAADNVVIRDRSQACSNSFAKLSSCLATAWITVCGKIVKTSFGTVDGQALEKLQDSFDTRELLRAVDAIDQLRYRDDDLRQDMLNLHCMARNLINQDYSSGTPRDESIGELA
jgi:hypothetical protein